MQKLPVYWEVAENKKSEVVEKFPELSLFYRLSSPLDSEMIWFSLIFCPCEEPREIREIFMPKYVREVASGKSLLCNFARYFYQEVLRNPV